MRIGVMGAGAVGCYYGAVLAKAGHAVTLVGRQSFVDSVSVNRLRLEMAGVESVLRVNASTDAAALADVDVVLFCVKSTDTEEAGRARPRTSNPRPSSSPSRMASAMPSGWRRF